MFGLQLILRVIKRSDLWREKELKHLVTFEVENIPICSDMKNASFILISNLEQLENDYLDEFALNSLKVDATHYGESLFLAIFSIILNRRYHKKIDYLH